MKKNVVIIPGYNEAKYIERVLRKVLPLAGTVVYVDDGSSDASVRIAKKYTQHVLHHETNLGKGAAMLTGAEYAFSVLGASSVVFMDADDQHDPTHLPEFFSKLQQYPIIFGVRYMGANMPLFRFLGNKFASVILNLLYGAYIADIPSGYKGMTGEGFSKIRWKSSGYEVETEIAMRVAQQRLPYEIIEIKAIYHDKDKGMTLLDAMQITKCLLQWRLGI